MTIELKACPFCGGVMTGYFVHSNGYEYGIIDHEKDCFLAASVGDARHSIGSGSAKAWNTRASLQVPYKERGNMAVKELREIAETIKEAKRWANVYLDEWAGGIEASLDGVGAEISGDNDGMELITLVKQLKAENELLRAENKRLSITNHALWARVGNVIRELERPLED